MKSNFLSLAMALSASLSVGSITAKPIVEPVQQNCVTETKSTSSEIMPMEGSESEIIDNDRPKPARKKRSTAGKIFDGFMAALVVTIVVLLLIVKGAE
jgi:hypothetical protein